MAVGYRCQPLPECDIAELHLLAGRREECDRLYAEVRERTPLDVWLYNHAGTTYQVAGDHKEALHWLTEGLELAMRTGDPVRQGEIMVLVPADVAVIATLQELCREPEAAQPVPRGLDIPDPTRWRVDNPHMKLFPQLYPRNWENMPDLPWDEVAPAGTVDPDLG